MKNETWLILLYLALWDLRDSSGRGITVQVDTLAWFLTILDHGPVSFGGVIALAGVTCINIQFQQ